MNQETSACDIRDVGKRRDGGHRYWCLKHRADATAKYGVPAEKCVAAADDPILPDEVISFSPDDFPGGVGIWGAVPAVYDTTTDPIDRGIHIHAREMANGKKHIDRTVRKLRVPANDVLIPDVWVEVDEIDAINFMVSSVFGFQMKSVNCTLCGFPHLDRDWFAVHRHKRHVCHGCGRKFSDVEEGIGNPAARLQYLFGQQTDRVAKPSSKKIAFFQADFPGGIRLWGSNPAIVWTPTLEEEEGIHIHAFDGMYDQPVLDDTYGQMTIDNIEIDPRKLRVFMAQCALPHIRERVVHLTCSSCGKDHFDEGISAYTPHIKHECHFCGNVFTANSRSKLTIGNPFVGVRAELATISQRSLQKHYLDLRIEAI